MNYKRKSRIYYWNFPCVRAIIKLFFLAVSMWTFSVHISECFQVLKIGGCVLFDAAELLCQSEKSKGFILMLHSIIRNVFKLYVYSHVTVTWGQHWFQAVCQWSLIGFKRLLYSIATKGRKKSSLLEPHMTAMQMNKSYSICSSVLGSGKRILINFPDQVDIGAILQSILFLQDTI